METLKLFQPKIDSIIIILFIRLEARNHVTEKCAEET